MLTHIERSIDFCDLLEIAPSEVTKPSEETEASVVKEVMGMTEEIVVITMKLLVCVWPPVLL